MSDDLETQIYEALNIASEVVCSAKCPSVFKTGEPMPHSEDCRKVEDARRAWMDHCSYLDLIASGGFPEADGPPASPDFAQVFAFLNSIEGAGYGGMAEFEIARETIRMQFRDPYIPEMEEDHD